MYEEVVAKVRSHIEGKVIAVYLTGSRLNNIAQEDSDFDVYAIVEPTPLDLVTMTKESYEFRTALDDGTEIQGKAYNTHQLVYVANKTNINVMEFLSQEPIWENDTFLPLKTIVANATPDYSRLRESIEGMLGDLARTYSKEQWVNNRPRLYKKAVMVVKAVYYFNHLDEGVHPDLSQVTEIIRLREAILEGDDVSVPSVVGLFDELNDTAPTGVPTDTRIPYFKNYLMPLAEKIL